MPLCELPPAEALSLLGNDVRATVLSGVSMVLSLAGAVARLAGGEVAAVTGPLAFLAGAGVALWIAVSPVGSAVFGPLATGPSSGFPRSAVRASRET